MLFSQQRNEVIRQRLRQLEQIYQERREVQVKKPAKPAPRRNGLWNQIVDYEDTVATGGVSIGARVIVKEKYNGKWSNDRSRFWCATQTAGSSYSQSLK